MLEIRVYPDPELRVPAEAVTVIDADLRKLAEAMIEAMYANKGVGLAAPQVGVGKRIVIVDIDPEARNPQVLINPVITRRGKAKEAFEEGCLSVPGINARVTRPIEVAATAQNLQGEVVAYEGGGLLGRALQHELDHLDGVLFIDKVGPATRFSLRDELRRLEDARERRHGVRPGR